MKNSEKTLLATTRFTLFLFLIVIGFALQAQTLSEKLGAVPTNFKFYSGETDLNVSQQFIIKNAGSYNYTGTTFDAGYGYGAGYEVFRLEFMTRIKLLQESERKAKHHFRIGFYNAEGKLLCSYNYPAKKVSVARNLNIDDSPLFYSIDLLDIPISLFDFTEKIDIIEVQ
jgi:hypothetical protein